MQGVLIYNIPNLYWSVDDIRHTLRRKCGGARDNNGNYLIGHIVDDSHISLLLYHTKKI